MCTGLSGKEGEGGSQGLSSDPAGLKGSGGEAGLLVHRWHLTRGRGCGGSESPKGGVRVLEDTTLVLWSPVPETQRAVPQDSAKLQVRPACLVGSLTCSVPGGPLPTGHLLGFGKHIPGRCRGAHGPTFRGRTLHRPAPTWSPWQPLPWQFLRRFLQRKESSFFPPYFEGFSLF